MKLGTKILLAAAIAVIVTTLGAFITVRYLAAKNRINDIHSGMSMIIQQAEEIAAKMDDMHRAKVFDLPQVAERSKAQTGGRPINEVYQKTDLYKIVPIVAAWTSVEKAAARQGYEFVVASRPDLPARNPKNNVGAAYTDAFKAFAAGEKEYFLRFFATFSG